MITCLPDRQAPDGGGHEEWSGLTKKFGRLYEEVAGNLVAYACKLSFQYGFDGFVSFTAKTKLIEHYEKTLGAYHFGGHRMIIPTKAAEKLDEKYFKS